MVMPLIVRSKLFCKECYISFIPKRNRQLFCCRKCAASFNGKNNKGRKHSKEINQKKGRSGSDNPFFGKHHTEETRNTIRQKNTGKKQSLETIQKRKRFGKDNHFFGKTHTAESKKKISENHFNSSGKNNPMYGKGYKLKGEKNGSWKGGVSLIYSEEFTPELKTKIRQRDNFTCQVCSKNGYAVHHIDYDKFNSIEKNLITLCGSCHAKTNFKREQWKDIFSKKIEEKYGN